MSATDSLLILSIDIGTSSTRSAFFDGQGRRIMGTTAQQTYPLYTTPDGGAELEAGAILRAVTECLQKTLGVYRTTPLLKGRRIAGVGVSCFWHSFVGTNAKGEAITRVYTWADSRCRDDAAALRMKLKEKEVHARTGCMLRASFWAAKLLWLRRIEPRLVTRAAQWMSPAEWLQLQLVGSANCAHGMATGTGLYSPSKLGWDAQMLKTAGLTPEQLRPLSDEPVEVGIKLAQSFPELKGVPWYPAIGDGAASSLGSGATRPGLAAVNVGTSAAVRVMRNGVKDAASPFGLFCYRVDEKRYLIGGAVSNAGNLRAWALRELRLTDGPELETALANRTEPKHGLTVLPFLNAERAPFWNEEDTGVIHGLRQSSTSLDILQAFTEATYQRLALIYEMVCAGEKTPPKLIVSGGIQKSASSLQRLANVFGQPVYPNDEPEASLRGASVFVLEKLGVEIPEIRLTASVRPQGRVARMFAEERERHRAMEKMLTKQKE